MLSIASVRVLDILVRHGRPFVDRQGNRRLKLQAGWRDLQGATGVSRGALARAITELEMSIGLLRHRATRRDLPGALSIPDPEMAASRVERSPVVHAVDHPYSASEAQKVIHRGGPPDFPAEGGVVHPVMSGPSYAPKAAEKSQKTATTPVDNSAPNGWGMGGSPERDVHHYPSG